MTTRGFIPLLATAVWLAAACTGTSRSLTTGPLSATAPTTTTAATTTATTTPASAGLGGSPASPPWTTSTATTVVTSTTKPPPARTTTTTGRTTTTRLGGGPPALVTITSASDQQTFALRVGDGVKLLLDDPANQWGPPSLVPDGLLAPDPSPSPPPHGQLRIWTAVRPGTVAIKAVGTAWCAAGEICPMYARLFQVAIVIS